MTWNGSLDSQSLRSAYKSGHVKPSDVLVEVSRRIEARGDDHVWTELVPRETLIAAAWRLEREGDIEQMPLFGLPMGVKDNFDVAGYRTSNACKAVSRLASETSWLVQVFLDAGAIFVGKQNMDQFGVGLNGLRTDFGAPSCAFDERYISGGSTSGGGVAVAAGLVSFAVGGDAAGSGRVPAALNNIVGLKPTPGLIPNSHQRTGAGMIGTNSVLTLTVEDAVAATSLAIAYDPADPQSRPEAEGFALGIVPPPRSFRFGVPSAATIRFHGDEGAATLFAASVERLEAMGGVCVEVDFDWLYEAALMLYDGAFIARRYANLGETLERHYDGIHPATREILSRGKNYSGADVFQALYRMDGYRQKARMLFRDIDVLVTPTTPTTFTKAELERDNIALNAVLGTYTNFVNLLDMCALALPGGFLPSGVPQGITLIAQACEDRKICAIGQAFFRSLDGTLGATGYRLPACERSVGAAAR